jgi:HEAT repeat protein
MLEDHDSDVRQSALEALTDLAPFGEHPTAFDFRRADLWSDAIRASICSPSTIVQVMSTLENRDSNVRRRTLEAIVVLAQYGKHPCPISSSVVG